MVSSSHCLDLDLNGLLTRRNFWRIPGMLGNYTIPKWKEFLKSREPILRKSYLSTFIHINKHMDGARSTLWIYFIIYFSLPLQMKSFGPKNFQFSCMGKKVPIWQFFRNADMVLFNLCMKIKHFLGKMYSFEVVNNSPS